MFTMQQVPAEVEGGWKFEKLLGQGADGVVALFAKGDERAVMKFPTPTGGRSFEREKAVGAKIRERQPQPNLVAQKFATSSFVAQDYVEGITLFQYGQQYDFTPATVKRIMQQIEAGVKALHELGFAHNDLHLANILINPTSGDVWIIDYGRSAYTWQDILSVHRKWRVPAGIPVVEADKAFIAGTAAWLNSLATRPCTTRNAPTSAQLSQADGEYTRAKDKYLAAARPAPNVLVPLTTAPPLASGSLWTVPDNPLALPKFG